MVKVDNFEIDNGIREYFKGIKDYKPLTKKEEKRLIRRYRKKGDLEARDTIIQANLKYACSLAHSYRGKGITFNELISEANSGLMEAVDKFDLKQDVKFCTYAKWWILQRIKLKMKKNSQLCFSDLPSEREKQIPDDAVDTPLNAKENDEKFTDSLDYNTVEEDKKEFLNTILDVLPKKEKDMIKMYYGIDGEEFNLELISKKYNISRERVRQIIEKSMLKVRSAAMVTDNQYL